MSVSVWVYQRSGRASFAAVTMPEQELFTVGFYDPAGNWEPESDHRTREAAAARVHYLNGGNGTELDLPKIEVAAREHIDTGPLCIGDPE